jgi:hypothetical protein
MSIPPWTSYIQTNAKRTVGDFRITPEEDSKEDGPNCTSVDLPQGNGRLIRITTKIFPHDDSATRVSGPPTPYVYFKLFKWDKTARKLLKAAQMFMNLYEYNDFLLSKLAIDGMLTKLLNAVGGPQPLQQLRQAPFNVKVEFDTEVPGPAFFAAPMDDCQ